MTKVFEVMAVKKDNLGNVTEIILQPLLIIAADEEKAKMKLLIDKNSYFLGYDLNEVEFLVRPFK